MANYGHPPAMSSTFVPGGFDDDYYMPVASPPLMAPEPQRINPDMSNQIAGGLQHMDLNGQSRSSYVSPPEANTPHLSPFPKLQNPPPNVPPSDDELEARLENARLPVLNSNDPEMQLAWAQDALTHVAICAVEAERLAALKPQQARAATPRIEHQLKSDAMNIVTFLADQHHPRAEFLRGMWLEWGRYGQREDKKEAFRCYSRAADRGYVRAEYRIGMLYEGYNDPAKALRHYHRGVDAGDAASCYRLGMMTIRGQHGQQQDYTKGIELIRKSAEGADENAAQGAYVYGMLLARELPQVVVPEQYLELNEQLAKQYIEKAAYMKFAKAQVKMGSAYELGSMGCEFSPALSIHYNALASKQGESDADMALSKWFLVGSEGLFPKNEELAYTYAERAASGALPTAEFALGYFNEIGMHVPVDLEKAEEWYQKAAKHGNSDAKNRLEGLSRKQVLTRTDHEKTAINRIKLQHGSMRGQRPTRFQRQQPSVGTIEESASGAPYGDGYGAVQPSRNSSRTPYPEDNGPPQIGHLPALDARPTSVAPYPMSDGPPPGAHTSPQVGTGPAGGFFNPGGPQGPRPATTINADRPTSAFGIRSDHHGDPNFRPNSTASVPTRQQPYPGRLAPAPLGGGLRPQTARPYEQRQTSAPAYGQGSAGYAQGGPPLHPHDPRTRPGMSDRVASGPAGMQNGRPHSTGPAPPGPGQPQHAPTAPAGAPGVDIGFAAPHSGKAEVPQDPTWRERRERRGSRGDRYNRGQDQALPQYQNLQSNHSMPNFNNPTQGNASRPESQPPPDQRRPTPSGSGPKPPEGSAYKPPAKESAPKPSTAAQVTAARPPGKGPKTFEEMGVPAGPAEKDCVVM
ncbi:Chitin synthase regulatory factor 4 [Fulvia fulva]|uniref:Chitin synthase regulatory factor 4 n=1 Tax=Passalora fulva TaxID=5499 RepID=A0A9Q8PJ86_PASFU|nr:Chitin synthase regulatory factor 4 [Fulvia fulva]KAK4612160.1 Chitin synthase regulatory factor 4 [Fulvia fulva]KAK4612724.1 Chitin synthase regulatory factor 4 [Fulvia fulva]UJO23473.1 Chitin synthase regulatory factor 4 [Fulvia fulva]WPV21466.1 Chitin synthase regulatory factor 4 [Fulvia fulva]WPV36246.1 Chitin synthase regulatory factor 4 [Fulvia fulva]